MALPAFLVPALAGFAFSKLTGASTKSALRNALLSGLTSGITEGFTAAQGAKEMGTISNVGAKEVLKGSVGEYGAGSVTRGINQAKEFLSPTLGKELFKIGKTPVTGGTLLKYGIPAAAIYKSFSDAAKAPKETMFYGANVAYADPRIYSQVGPKSFKVGQYDDQGQMTAVSIPGAENYVPPEEVYRSGGLDPVPYAKGKQLITAKEGGLATLKGIQKYNSGGQVLPSKLNYDENDAHNYVRANGHVVDMSDIADKDEDTVLAQLADGEFVTRADGVLGAGILAGANPNNMKEMRKEGAKYFYDQQAKFKRIFDLLQKGKNKAN